MLQLTHSSRRSTGAGSGLRSSYNARFLCRKSHQFAESDESQPANARPNTVANITDEYTLDDGVGYEGIVESVTKSYAKVRFDEDNVTKQLNLFKEFEGSKRLSNFLEEGKAWKWVDTD